MINTLDTSFINNTFARDGSMFYLNIGATALKVTIINISRISYLNATNSGMISLDSQFSGTVTLLI